MSEQQKTTKILESQTGIALLLVLFVVSLLIIVAAEFAFTTRMEITNARFFKEDIEGYYYAQAGFQYALTEVIGKFDGTYLAADGQIGFYRNWLHDNPDDPKTADGSDSDTPESWPPLPVRSGIPIGKGKFDYLITDEEGRINLNYLESRVQSGNKSMRNIFREVLLATGVPEGEEPDIIIDSILDWVDRNDEHRLNGAESDWYEHNYAEKGFSLPYSCKNQPLDTIDELLMIRGMTPDILYGSDSIFAMESNNDGPEYSGILPYVTVYGYHRKINEGSAAPLLLSIMDPDNAEQKFTDRLNRGADGKKQMSRTFRIEVRGYSDTADVDHILMAVVRRSQRRDTGGGAEIYYWNDNAMDFGRDLAYFEEFGNGL
ncbi:general secretion pathway protein GspK [bacterium]|nr:general secretion pathway protein GspK [candidate division CSSED10-310 bacterium]